MTRNLREKYFWVDIMACRTQQTKQNTASWRFILFDVNASPTPQNHKKNGDVETPPPLQNMSVLLIKKNFLIKLKN